MFMIGHAQLPYLSFRDKLSTFFKAEPDKEEFWALNDVSFQVNPGESIGIIGRNGAGKSTLLKILSRITPPTKGSIISRGRIASLLEVGTGFHQELTGRENIFMNGSILGMKNSEIRARFDEIVEFSGTEKFLDTALKHYSSGMQLRLAFAVAAHLEPEILIIDEVLAVGDAEFQRKCLTKMEDVTHSGRTILFVSHSLPSLKTICSRGIMLQEGKLVYEGSMSDVIDRYTSQALATGTIVTGVDHLDPRITVEKITINGSDLNEVTLVDQTELELIIEMKLERRIPFDLLVHIKQNDVLLASYAGFVDGSAINFEKGRHRIRYRIRVPNLKSGKYKIDLFFEETLFHGWQ